MFKKHPKIRIFFIVFTSIVILVIIALAILFFQGKDLISEFGRADKGPYLQLKNNEILYAFNYDICSLQNRDWSTNEGICIIEYSDANKVCSTGEDCLSNKCILDSSIYDQWINSADYPYKFEDPYESVSSQDRSTYHKLPDTMTGKCAVTNLCYYTDPVIYVDDGIRHAWGSNCNYL